MIEPKLRPIDMSRSDRNDHPDIRTGIEPQYLCLIGGRFFCGRFSREHYGLNFIGWINPVGLQFDAPGTNASRWEMIWEIIP